MIDIDLRWHVGTPIVELLGNHLGATNCIVTRIECSYKVLVPGFDTRRRRNVQVDDILDNHGKTCGPHKVGHDVASAWNDMPNPPRQRGAAGSLRGPGFKLVCF